jgi:hypothetical protein
MEFRNKRLKSSHNLFLQTIALTILSGYNRPRRLDVAVNTSGSRHMFRSYRSRVMQNVGNRNCRSAKVNRTRLRLHGLEDRTVPNSYTVNVLTDTNSGTGTTGDLRYCITQANLDGQADTISFTVAGTINLTGGQLPITTAQPLTISGPGAATLSIAGAAAATTTNRIFNVSDGVNVTISGLTLTGGNLASGNSGAAIAMGAATVTLSFTTVSGNKSASNGGAINLSGTSGTLNVNDSTVKNNAANRGGGIHVDNSGSLTVGVLRSTISGNTATGGGPGGGIYFEYNGTCNVDSSTVTGNVAGTGGGIQSYSGTVNVTNSTISNNSASANGGGVLLAIVGSALTMSNSTVSGNSCGGNGGGIDSGSGTINVTNSSLFGNIGNQGGAFCLLGTPGSLMVSNSSVFNNTAADGGAFRLNGCNTDLILDNDTIVGNSASTNAGGINRFGGSGAISIESTIIANNLASGVAGHPDVENNGTLFSYKNSLIGNTNGITNPNDLGGNLTGIDPQLFGPANNGGPTLTLLPHLGSPVLDVGSNPLGLATDQRGVSRMLGTGVDMGAVELDQTIPQVSGTFSDVTTAGGTSYTLQVTYVDKTAINTGSIDSSDIKVTGPNGFSVIATFVPPVTGATTPVTATYTFTPPGGNWNGPVNGTYTVSMQPNQVTNTNSVAVPAGVIGTFNVAVPQGPQTFVVTNANDNGPGSLRQAIINANSVYPSSDTINFDASYFNQPRTITLSTGQLTISDSVFINGPGVNLLTIDANHLSRVFSLSSTTAMSVTISGATVTGGSASNGGGIDVGSAGVNLTLTGDSVSHNIAASAGGGIHIVPGTNLMVQSSTIANNYVSGVGGAIDVDHPTTTSPCCLNILNSTISGNSATGDGGGVYWTGVVGAAGFSFVQSTFANNRNDTNGAAIRLNQMDGTLVIRNCTIAFNTVTVGNGGGMDYYHPASFVPTVGDLVTIESTIFDHNFAPGGGDDIRNDNNPSIPPVVLHTTIFQDTVGFNYTSDATDFIAFDAALRALADNGGPTLTCLPQLTSPALNTGSNPAGLMTDQRGQNRVIGAGIDMGAVELDPNIPIAVGTFADVKTKGANLYTLTVTYLDDNAVKVSTIDSFDIRITGPNGFNVPATFVPPANPNSDNASIVATYTFVPPGGTWDSGDDGVYSVRMQANQVSDTGVPPAYVQPVVVGNINVAIPLDLVVNATNDESTDTDGKTSLREALQTANGFPAGGNITFDPTVFSSAKTIALSLGQLNITAPMSIVGPAAGVTIDAGAKSRAFFMDVPFSSGNAISLSNMSIINGLSSGFSGGGIRDVGENLTLTNVSISGCSSTVNAGAIYVLNGGQLTLVNSKLLNNSTPGRGGAVFLLGPSDVVLQNSTVSGNTSGNTGGGFYFYNQGSFVANGSTIANNTSNGGLGGGGVYFYGKADANGIVLTNCTIAGNSAASNGGGIRLNAFSGTAIIQNCTITNNASSSNGGGISCDNNLTVTSSIISGNLSPTSSDFYVPATVTANVSLIGSNIGVSTFNGDPFTNTNIGVNPMLDPAGLAFNGGLTQTIALQPGSPAINNGSNPTGALFDQRGNTRVVGPAADIGAYEVQAPAKFSSVVINGGAAQRSMVTQVTVNFNQHIGFSGAPAAAFALKRVSDNAVVNLAASVDDSGAGTAVTLTFTGGAVNGASLADGRYALTILASGFDAEGFDGNGNGTAQGSPADDFSYAEPSSPAPLDTTKIFRIYGDVNGDGTVSASDFIVFRQYFGGYLFAFDFDGDGSVAASDFIQFRLRFGGSI